MSGVVVWITGVPSSGKSTLAAALALRVRAGGLPCCVLDGDEVRSAIVPTPGYDERARDEFYLTLANLAALCARQGLCVLVAATAHRASFRDRARSLAPAYLEVFVDVSPEEAERRDAKGLYRAVTTGKAKGVPGADLAYERPVAPDVTTRGVDDGATLDKIVEMIRGKA